MGEETTQFASRFALAVDLLGGIATAEGLDAARRKHGARLEAAVADALEAVAAVYQTRTEAVRNWSERRAQVLARVSAVRAALARGGLDAAVRREAAALAGAVEGGE
jgi:phage baseplate assembly protein W